MAQSGSVLAWGARGRGFKSRYPDTSKMRAFNDLKALFVLGRVQHGLNICVWNFRLFI